MGNCGGSEESVIQEEVEQERRTNNNSNKNNNHNYSGNGPKVSLVGDSGVGKSAIMTRIMHNRWDTNKEATIGVAFAEKKIRTKEGEVINLKLWDTAGQERFRSLVSTYLRGCAGIIMVYSVDSLESFEAVEKTWLPACVDVFGDDLPPIFLIANKMDLPEEEHQVSRQMGEQFAKEGKFHFFSFSALNGTGGDQLVLEVSLKSMEFSVSKISQASSVCY